MLDAGVEKESDIGDTETGGTGDFLVTESMLKFEADDLALIMRELSHDIPYLIKHFLVIAPLFRPGLQGFKPVHGLAVVRVNHAIFLPQNIESAVAADGVKPGLAVLTDPVGISEVELEKSVLHHVTRPRLVTKNAASVGDERTLVLSQSFPNQSADGIKRLHWWRCILHRRNDQMEDLLDENAKQSNVRCHRKNTRCNPVLRWTRWRLRLTCPHNMRSVTNSGKSGLRLLHLGVASL